MKATRASTNYAPLTRHLHWVMLAVLVGVFSCIELRVLFAKGSDPREALKGGHALLGLTALALTTLRLFARFGQTTPPIQPAPPRWQQHAATAMHALLYAWLLVMPLAGWLMLSAAGKPIPFFGLELMPLVAPDKELASLVKECHEIAGRCGYVLIGFHAASALAHHFIRRDDTLLRMLPLRTRAGS